MLKKFTAKTSPFAREQPVYLVTRTGDILEGFYITEILMDLVSLNCSPLDGSEKQGFTIEGRLLRPNWCAGKRKFEAACLTRQEAEKLVEEIHEQQRQGNRKAPVACSSGATKKSISAHDIS